MATVYLLVMFVKSVMFSCAQPPKKHYATGLFVEDACTIDARYTVEHAEVFTSTEAAKARVVELKTGKYLLGKMSYVVDKDSASKIYAVSLASGTVRFVEVVE